MAEHTEPKLLPLSAAEHCLYDPGYVTGAYYCSLDRGHPGRHRLVPGFLVAIAPADAEPAI